MAISRTKNGGKQSFNAPFSASHLEKTRISASDFASQSRTNEKPPVVRRGNPKRIQDRQSSAAATQNVCRTAGHLPLVHLGIHPGHYRRMSGGNSYVFEISGGNSHTIQQVPSRKRMEIRHSFSNERKPPVIQIGKTEERMEIRQSFGANGKMNARGFAIRSQTKENRQSSRSTQASGRQLTAANSR